MSSYIGIVAICRDSQKSKLMDFLFLILTKWK